ncbi:MAG: CBS domain-containing protein [Rubrivivax sp.]|nr:CBS domain-containing protein [Rubrivivax sp.]
MTVASICSRDIVSVPREAPLTQAARLMREHHVGTVVVTEAQGEGQRIVGLVTDRDLVIEALARGIEGAALPVAALLASGPLLAVPESADLGEAIALMRKGGVRRLLVHDDEGHLVGVLSFDDLLRVCGAQIAGLAAVLAEGREREEAAQAARPAVAATRADPAAPPSPPRPRLRVPSMGTAGWPAQKGLAP